MNAPAFAPATLPDAPGGAPAAQDGERWPRVVPGTGSLLRAGAVAGVRGRGTPAGAGADRHVGAVAAAVKRAVPPQTPQARPVSFSAPNHWQRRRPARAALSGPGNGMRRRRSWRGRKDSRPAVRYPAVATPIRERILCLGLPKGVIQRLPILWVSATPFI